MTFRTRMYKKLYLKKSVALCVKFCKIYVPYFRYAPICKFHQISMAEIIFADMVDNRYLQITQTHTLYIYAQTLGFFFFFFDNINK